MKVFLIVSVILLNLISTGLLLTAGRSTDIIGTLIVFVVFSAILQAILSFHMWSAVNDGKSGINPYLAAGLHFIPLLGFLWTLISFGMYPSAYNSYTDRQKFSAAYIDSSPFNTYILVVLGSLVLLLIPIIKLIVPLVLTVLYLRVIATACDGVSTLKYHANYHVLDMSGERTPSGNPLSINI